MVVLFRVYHNLLSDGDELFITLQGYTCGVDGIGYKHRKGTLRIIGSKMLYLGTEMKGGK